jgi:excisionase family DNA binding protein
MWCVSISVATDAPSGDRVVIQESRLLRVKEVADALAVSNMTIYRLIREGELAAVRVGHGWRISEGDLAAYLDRAKA